MTKQDTLPPLEQELAAFEAWAEKQECYGTAGRLVDYAYGATRDAWKVWQARAALAAQAPQLAEAAGHDAADGHLSALVDEAHRILAALHQYAIDLQEYTRGGRSERGEVPIMDLAEDWLAARPDLEPAPQSAAVKDSLTAQAPLPAPCSFMSRATYSTCSGAGYKQITFRFTELNDANQIRLWAMSYGAKAANHVMPQQAPQQAQGVAEPRGWIVWWPRMGGGYVEHWHSGAKKPSFGSELDALLKSEPVYAAAPQAAPAPQGQWADVVTADYRSDELVWLYDQGSNTIDGPRIFDSSIDPDRYTHWAPCEAPSTRAIDAPRALTDEQIREIWVEHGLDDEAVEDFARAIERAHGIGAASAGGQ